MMLIWRRICSIMLKFTYWEIFILRKVWVQ
ncbi:hypothetical protein LR69_04479 [Geobacillus sp. BCO2]|nr:hypothetical protein LR69_04479 [Geobacillus sp. BCO2]